MPSTLGAPRQETAVHDSEAGVTSVEYGIIAAFIGVAMIVAGPSLAAALTDFLGVVLDAILG
jgi:Flp pilus assembly pilin Flp